MTALPPLSELVALLPCPFCGKSAAFDPPSEYSGAPVFTIRCCIASTGMKFSKEDAHKAWNTRAPLLGEDASFMGFKVTVNENWLPGYVTFRNSDGTLVGFISDIGGDAALAIPAEGEKS